MEMDPDDPDRTVPVKRNPFPLPPTEVAAPVIRLMDPEEPVSPRLVAIAMGPVLDDVLVVDPDTTNTPDPVVESVDPPSTEMSPARPPVAAPVPSTIIPLDPSDDVPELISTPPELPDVAAPENTEIAPDEPDEAVPDAKRAYPVLPRVAAPEDTDTLPDEPVFAAPEPTTTTPVLPTEDVPVKIEMDPELPDRTVPVKRNPFPLPPFAIAGCVSRDSEPELPALAVPVAIATKPPL